MSRKLTVQLGEDLAKWVEDRARATGRSQGSLVKEALEKVRQGEQAKPFIKLGGSLGGSEVLSRRKGFSKS